MTKNQRENKGKAKTLMVAICSFVLSLFILNLISAVPPQSTVINLERGVDIIHPETLTIKEGTDLEFNFWTYNSTTGATLTNTSLNCTVYFIDSTGTNFFRLSNQPGASGLITYGKGAPLCVNCWTSKIGYGNFTQQQYSYQIKCQGSGVGGYDTGFFEVTPSGKSGADNTAFYIFIIILFYALNLISYFGKSIPLTILTGMGMIFLGIYLISNGVIIYRDNITLYIAYLTIAVGAITAIIAGIEQIQEGY